MEGPDVERVTGSEEQQVQRTEAEEKGLRGPAYWEWSSGTDDKVCIEFAGNSRRYFDAGYGRCHFLQESRPRLGSMGASSL